MTDKNFKVTESLFLQSLALLISLGLAIMIRKRALKEIDLDEYIESWDSLTIQKENDEKTIISDDELDL